MRFRVAFLAVLYRGVPVFMSLGRMLFSFVMIPGFMMDRRGVMMLGGFVMLIGGLDMMLGSGML